MSASVPLADSTTASDGTGDDVDIVPLTVPLACAICIIYIFVALAIHHYKETYHHMPWIHESSVACLIGLITGGVLQLSTGHAVQFDNNLFFYLVLPPIIFSAGYSLKRKRFFKYIDLIAFFGIIGTVMNFLLIAAGSFAYGRVLAVPGSFKLSWYEALIFSAVLVGSDEVSARSLVRIKDFPRLGALIFGEGVVNDALSIVLFETFRPMYEQDATAKLTNPLNAIIQPIHDGSIIDHDQAQDQEQLPSLPLIMQSILLQLVCSLAIGASCGLVHARLMKQLPITKEFPVYQTALVMMFGYLSYSLAEALGISGILTVFIAAIALAHYSWYSLASSARISTRVSFAAISEIAEGFAFSYVGLSLWAFEDDAMNWTFAIYMLIVVFVARIITIFGFFYLCQFCFKSFRVPLSEQLVFMLGGVVRGCLCWAQILQVRHSPVLVTSTLLIVMTTLLGSGVLLPVLLPTLTQKDTSNVETTTVAGNDDGGGGGVDSGPTATTISADTDATAVKRALGGKVSTKAATKMETKKALKLEQPQPFSSFEMGVRGRGCTTNTPGNTDPCFTRSLACYGYPSGYIGNSNIVLPAEQLNNSYNNDDSFDLSEELINYQRMVDTYAPDTTSSPSTQNAAINPAVSSATERAMWLWYLQHQQHQQQQQHQQHQHIGYLTTPPRLAQQQQQQLLRIQSQQSHTDGLDVEEGDTPMTPYSLDTNYSDTPHKPQHQHHQQQQHSRAQGRYGVDPARTSETEPLLQRSNNNAAGNISGIFRPASVVDAGGGTISSSEEMWESSRVGFRDEPSLSHMAQWQWARFDETFMKPLFGGSDKRVRQLRNQQARHLQQLQQLQHQELMHLQQQQQLQQHLHQHAQYPQGTRQSAGIGFPACGDDVTATRNGTGYRYGATGSHPNASPEARGRISPQSYVLAASPCTGRGSTSMPVGRVRQLVDCDEDFEEQQAMESVAQQICSFEEGAELRDEITGDPDGGDPGGGDADADTGGEKV